MDRDKVWFHTLFWLAVYLLCCWIFGSIFHVEPEPLPEISPPPEKRDLLEAVKLGEDLKLLDRESEAKE